MIGDKRVRPLLAALFEIANGGFPQPEAVRPCEREAVALQLREVVLIAHKAIEAHYEENALLAADLRSYGQKYAVILISSLLLLDVTLRLVAR